MQFSGYSQSYRYEVMKRAFRKYNSNPNETRRRKSDKRRWYNEDKYDGVMFVDTTPNGELKT